VQVISSIRVVFQSESRDVLHMPNEGRWMGRVVLELLLLRSAIDVDIVCPHAMTNDDVELFLYILHRRKSSGLVPSLLL